MTSDDRTELAEDRTDLAEDRTLLAHERSFAGWLRTGMAAVGIGLGFNALFQSMEPLWAPKVIARSFLMVAIFVFISAERRACATFGRLDADSVNTLKPVRIRVLTWFLVAATVALTATLWFASHD